MQATDNRPGFLSSLYERIEKWESTLGHWPRWRFLLVGTVSIIGLSLFFFCPRLAVLQKPLPDTFEWARGVAYIDQCASPFTRSYDPALRWRVLPPLVAHFLGLRGLWTLLVPWAGVVALVVASLSWGERWLKTRIAAWSFGLLVGTSSAVLVPTNWIGINDAWCWLALVAVTCGRNRWTLAAACLLGPWVDERFFLGLPLALWCRDRLRGERRLIRNAFSSGLWLLPYIATRLAITYAYHQTGERHFLREAYHELPHVLTWVPLGWWFGLRLGWIPILASLRSAVRDRTWFWEIAAAGFALGMSVALAHDLSRSVAIALPWVFLGAARMTRENTVDARRLLCLLAGANLLLPAAHVVYVWVVAISPLPWEIFHLFVWNVDKLPDWVRPFL